MTDEQKFLFDLKGWILLPAVLSTSECETVKAHLFSGGSTFTGPAQELLDHPVLAQILNDILAEQPPAEEYYNFRCESSFVTIRHAPWKATGANVPHVVRPPQHAGAMRYQVDGGRIFSALTRVVWELNPVEKQDGGTLFLSGSHKARFPYLLGILQPDNCHLESYCCPAGSVFIFTESLLHAATDWKNPDVDRVAIFNCYNSLWAQWHRLNLAPEVIETMPPKRQSLFRGVFANDFHQNLRNTQYSGDNRAL